MKEQIEIATSRQVQMKEVTQQLQEIVERQKFQQGVCIVYCPHTTAGLAINENTDPDVCSDLERAFAKTVPEVRFDHVEGNSPAHYKICGSIDRDKR